MLPVHLSMRTMPATPSTQMYASTANLTNTSHASQHCQHDNKSRPTGRGQGRGEPHPHRSFHHSTQLIPPHITAPMYTEELNHSITSIKNQHNIITSNSSSLQNLQTPTIINPIIHDNASAPSLAYNFPKNIQNIVQQSTKMSHSLKPQMKSNPSHHNYRHQ